MIRPSIILLVWILAVACGTKLKESRTSVEMKKFVAESTVPCNSDSVPCARFEVNYPLFPGLDKTVQTKLQQQFDKAVNSGEPGDVKSMDAEGKEFIDEYKEFKALTPDNATGWYRNVAITLLLFNDSLLSLQVTDESYAGGAHGNYALTFINVRPESGETFRLSDILKPGYDKALNVIGEEVFRKTRELPDTASFEFNGYTFPDNHFGLNDNYGFSQEGISFYFNSYEVAPYVMGPTEVLIPYDRIKEWMK